MEVKVTWKTVLYVLLGVGVIILLVSALIHYEVKAAREEARAEQAIRDKEDARKEYGLQVEKVRQETKALIDASNEVLKSIKSAQDAQAVLLRNIPNAKPIVVQVPASSQASQGQKPELPDAPQPQVKKDNLLCYDEKGQIELAKFSEQCRQTSIALGGAQAEIVQKDKIITTQDSEITTLKNVKTPGFWRKTWSVTKVALPAALTAYLIGRAQKGH